MHANNDNELEIRDITRPVVLYVCFQHNVGTCGKLKHSTE